MLDYLKEMMLDVLLELSDQVNLAVCSDREQIVEEVVGRLTEEYLFEGQTEDELDEEIRRLKDENESLWAMLDEIKKSDTANYSEELSNMVNQKLSELALLIKAKPQGGYKN